MKVDRCPDFIKNKNEKDRVYKVKTHMNPWYKSLKENICNNSQYSPQKMATKFRGEINLEWPE